MGRILLYTLAGAAAGLLTAGFADFSGLIHLPDAVDRMTPGAVSQTIAVGMAFGLLIAVLLGIADGLLKGGQERWPSVIGVGVGVGLIAGFVGIGLGMAFFGFLYRPNASNPLAFVWNVLARAIGWALIGALAGTANGWRKWSFRVGRNGLIGGLIGGALGGMTFEIIPYLLPGIRPGPISRLFGFVITGGMIGLFVALVQELLKEAWVRVVLGRNEGKEFLIEKTRTTIGRAELSDIPLFGDPNVARTHARIEAQPTGGGFVLVPAATGETSKNAAPLLLNQEAVHEPTPLKSGDQIQIAARQLVFYERYTRERTRPVNRDVRPQTPVSATTLSAPSVHRLVAVRGPYAGRVYDLTGGLMRIIGRDVNCAVALPDDSKASRQHAQILAESGVWTLEDLGSTNGTFVNGQRITRQTLTVGDAVRIGTTEMRFE